MENKEIITSVNTTTDLAKRQKILKEFIQGVIERKVVPFFKQYLPELYDENLEIVVDFRDNEEEVRIGADKNSNAIHYHVNEFIEDLKNIGEQLTTFQSITGEHLENDLKLPREDAYALHLIHEFAHKYHWNIMRDNTSYNALKTINSEYFFPAIDYLKSIGRKMNMRSPQEIISYVQNLSDSEIPDSIKEEMEFLNKTVASVRIMDFANDKYKFDNNLGIDVDETFAKSLEKIFIESADLTPNVKQALLTYRQDWFENHPIIETPDIESKASKTYSDEVLYRLYNEVGKDKFVEYLRRANYFEFAKLRVKDAETGQFTEEYKQFLQNPEQYFKSIGIDTSKENMVFDILSMLSSEQAIELGIDANKYKEVMNQLRKQVNTQKLGRETLEEQKDTALLDGIEEAQAKQEAITNQIESQENAQNI